MFSYKELNIKLVTLIVVLTILSFVVLFLGTTVIKQGEVGVVTRFGRATGREMNAGLNWKIPFAEGVVKMDSRIKRSDITVGAGTKDLQTINSYIVLNYHIASTDASEIFNSLGDDDNMYEKVISPAVQEVVKSVFSQYKAEELLTKRDEVKAIIDERLGLRLEQYWIHIDDVSLIDITFSQEFDRAIEAKQVAEQLAQKAKYEVETAKAEAEKNKVQTEALTPEILQKMWIEKWNGVLPTVVSDDSNVMYNLGNVK